MKLPGKIFFTFFSEENIISMDEKYQMQRKIPFKTKTTDSREGDKNSWNILEELE